jgi:hypothetical protein
MIMMMMKMMKMMMMMTMMMIMIMIATRDMDSSTLHSANPTYKLQSWEESVLYS